MVSRWAAASRLCLACHYRVMTDDPKAFVGLPEVKVGLLPGAGGTQRMPRLIGIANSLPFLLEGTQHFRSGSQEARPRARGRAGGRTDRRGEALAARRARSAVQPWDQKGFRIPGGAGFGSAAVAADLPGRDGTRREEDAAQLSGAGRDPVVRVRGHASCRSTRRSKSSRSISQSWSRGPSPAT